MSLRWKLFRFLSVEPVLPPWEESQDAENVLFPSLLPSHGQENQAKHDLLRRFSAAADQCNHADSYRGLYIFALLRDAVQVFNLAVLDKNLSLSSSPSLPPTPLQHTFSAHETSVVAVKFVHATEGKLPWVVTLGMDHSSTSVKIWSFKFNNYSELPLPQPSTSKPFQSPSTATNDHNVLKCLCTYRLSTHLRPTALSVRTLNPGQEDISQIAVGFDDGSVTFLHGDISQGRAGKTRVAPAPGEMTPVKPIVFLHFCGHVLYCVSQISICTIIPVVANDKYAFRREILDNLGVERTQLCCVLTESAELVVAKPEALYFFNREGRGPCLAFQTVGDKASINSAGNYIFQCSGDGSITAYDVVNKLIAYRCKGVVSRTFEGYSDGTRLALLCILGKGASGSGSVLKASEISLEDRVNMLLRRGLYLSAVALARAESANQPEHQKDMLTCALRQYSEFLMTKNRYDEAAEKLVETIGRNVEPSWVVSRLVEQSGLRSGLRLYLEALHAAGKADFVHTKVLITCYRHDRARATILGDKASEKTTDGHVINVFSDVDWSEEQVDAAISLCREAGLFKVAERVSRRRNRYVQLACTLLEDSKQPLKTLELLRSLPDEEAMKVLDACARKLLVEDPESFVQYLAEAICRSTAAMSINSVGPTLKLASFLPIFVDKPQWRAVLLDKLVKAPGGITAADAPMAWILLFESLACIDVAERMRPSTGGTDGWSEKDSVSGPSDFEGESSLAIRSTPGSVREKRSVGKRALRILQSRRSVMDLRAALEIAEQYGHELCLEYLYEHLRMYKELGMSLRTSENRTALVRACRRHGDREPELWIECIRLFAPLAAREEYGENKDGVNNAGKKVQFEEEDVADESSGSKGLERFPREYESEKGMSVEILEEAMVALDRSGIFSALEIIEIVRQACPDGAWGLVREYFERCTTSLQKDGVTAEQGSVALEVELKELQKEIGRLSDGAFAMNSKTCSTCDDELSVPAVHFYCKHAYHVNCLTAGGIGGEGGVAAGATVDGGEMWSEDCPKCAPELDGMIFMRQALQEKNSRHDEFFKAVKSSRDGLATIIEFLELSPFI